LDASCATNLPLQEIIYAGHMTIRPEPTGLSAARNKILRVSDDLCFDEEARLDILLAVGEALSNAYQYGSVDKRVNLIYLGWHFADDILTVTIRDEGPGFMPYESKERDNCISPRGYGFKIMRRSVDHVHFEFDNGAKVILKKRICIQPSIS